MRRTDEYVNIMILNLLELVISLIPFDRQDYFFNSCNRYLQLAVSRK